ncbi:MAG: TatD family hydrolase [Planctomycetaceae bacterium]|nr:TatD family hydrolase [Planctomycetaceae bacterium]
MRALFDAHCHLDPENGDVAVSSTKICKTEPVAVCGRLLCAVEPDEFPRVEAAASEWPRTWLAFGVHPWYSATAVAAGGWRETVETALHRHPGAWVGEIGLDGLKLDRSPMDDQETVFRAHLRLAKDFNRPVNLHCVKAWEPLVAALDSRYLADGARPFIMHSFAGPYQFVEALAERGAYFTVGQLAARQDSRKGRERAALFPEDRLLLESDSFLVPGSDDVHELSHALNWLADVRGTNAESLAAILCDNAARLFPS